MWGKEAAGGNVFGSNAALDPSPSFSNLPTPFFSIENSPISLSQHKNSLRSGRPMEGYREIICVPFGHNCIDI